MKHLLSVTILMVALLGCNLSDNGDPEKMEWEEIGHTPFSDIKSGVAVYDKTIVTYKRDGKAVMKLRFGAPVVIDFADKEEKWGYFQFPNIYYGEDDQIVASWSMHADAISSYGTGGVNYAVSRDGGKTWEKVKDPVLKDGLLLPNGDKIKIHTPQALKVDTLKLPEPVGESFTHYPDKGSYTYLYKVSELPKQLQGVYINRQQKGENTWKVEQATLNDPLAVRYSRQGLFPVVWWGDMHVVADGSVIAGVYPGFSLEEDGKINASGVFFYRSDDNGHSWNIISRIPYIPDPEADPHGSKRLIRGYHEPAYEILNDGSLLCIMRSSDGLGISPMYYTRSTDMGVTWTKPQPFTRNGVKPKMVLMDNGVIALASGRPGMQVRFCTDNKGERWTDPFEMLPFESEKESVSCGYPSLLVTGENKFLIIYSDFKFKNPAGEIRKAIKVREIEVNLIN